MVSGIVSGRVSGRVSGKVSIWEGSELSSTSSQTHSSIND